MFKLKPLSFSQLEHYVMTVFKFLCRPQLLGGTGADGIDQSCFDTTDDSLPAFI